MEFYFEIKGKSEYGWLFPPLYSYKVSAKNNKEARDMINKMYSKKFPMRVLSKDLDSNDFLLNLREIRAGDKYLNRLWDVKICIECKKKFRRIDLYNDGNCKYKGTQFCSDECNEKQKERGVSNLFVNEKAVPVIYKITNKNTGMCYVGKTTQPFTLRWWQHFAWSDDKCNFHEAISKSKLTDWIFEIVEIVEDIKNISKIESNYIKKFNSIESGYNTLK